MDSFLSATAERAADASSASILRRPVALGGLGVAALALASFYKVRSYQLLDENQPVAA